MPITTVHPDYEENKPVWEFCEDFYDGERAVKKNAKKYVQKLSGQTDEKFRAYVQRAPFYPVASRTVTALAGAVFRKAPSITLPAGLEYLLKDATGTGMSLTAVAQRLTTEVFVTGRAGLLVDRPVDGGSPYLTIFDADDILNWDQTTGNEFVVLEDEKLVKGKDKFTLEEKEGYRELTKDIDGNYIVNIWEKKDEVKDGEEEFYIADTFMPIKNGKPIQYLPFTCIGPYAVDFEVARPPILELCEVQRIHFALSCDYANALHTICVPTPVISADLQADESFTLHLGPDTSIMLPGGGTASFLEFKGNGIGSVETAMTKYETYLANLGARMIETKNQMYSDTATAANQRESAATAVVSGIITSVEEALEKCLRWIADWENKSPDEVRVSLNKELVKSSMDSNMLTAMTQAVQAGTMSLETYYHNIQEAGLTDPGVTFEAESKRIQEGVVANQSTNVANIAPANTVSGDINAPI